MANPVITYIDVDLTANNNFDFVRAVQGDNSSRYAYVYVLENQQPYITSANKDSLVAVLEGTKPDGKTILNEESIVEENGNYYIAVEITEQMTAVAGIGKFEVSIYTSSTDTTTYDTRLTSFPFKLYVSESAFDISVTSTNEWKSLTEALSHVAEIRIIRNEVQVLADDAAVSESNAATSEANAATSETNAAASETNAAASSKESKSWAVGGTSSRSGEDTNNSKYWSEKSEEYKKTSESWAVGGTNTRTGEDTNNSKYWSEKSETSNTSAQSWAVGGTSSRSGEDTNNAKYWSDKSDSSQKLSESWAIGGTNSRSGEDTNNSKYWSTKSDEYQKDSKSWAVGDNSDGTRTQGSQDVDQSSLYYTNKTKGYYDAIKGDISGIALKAKGAWVETETYKLYDVVMFSGNSYLYVAPSPSSGNRPPANAFSNEFWQMMAQGASGSEIIKQTEPAADEQSVGGFWDMVIS